MYFRFFAPQIFLMTLVCSLVAQYPREVRETSGEVVREIRYRDDQSAFRAAEMALAAKDYDCSRPTGGFEKLRAQILSKLSSRSPIYFDSRQMGSARRLSN
jgi:hypothetical protein